MSKFKYTGNARAIPTLVEEKKGGKKTGKMLKEFNAGTVVAGVEFPTGKEVEVAEDSAAFKTVSHLAGEEEGPFEACGGKNAPAKKAPAKKAAPKAPPAPPAKKEGDK